MSVVALFVCYSLFAVGLNVVGARVTRAVGFSYPYWAPVTLLGFGVFGGVAAQSFQTSTVLLCAAAAAIVDSGVSTPTAWELGALPQYKEREEVGRVMRFLLPAAAVAMTGAAYGGVLVSRVLS